MGRVVVGGIYLAVALLFDVNVSTGGAQSPGRWIHRKKPQFVKGWMIHWKNHEKPSPWKFPYREWGHSSDPIL